MHNIRPVAGRMRPNTRSSGIFNTKRNSAVSVSRLTRMLVPKPKKAFQSPGTQIFGLLMAFIGHSSFRIVLWWLLLLVWGKETANAARTVDECETQPKIPPWALIIFNPISWNSGKYDPTQSDGTRHS